MKKFSFLEELLEKGTIGDLVDSIGIHGGQQAIYKSASQDKSLVWDQAFVCTDVPDYMNVAFSANGNDSFEKSVATFEGSYIDLARYKDLDAFLRAKLSPKRISRLKAYKRTLERVFPITYQYYYGSISDKAYDLLMDSLKGMITKRFREKKMEHLALNEWEGFKANGKKLIQEKKGALIVIMHDDRPIHISFNYVWEKVVFGFVRGFDVDYSKFYLGYIDILIQLEWCFSQNFHIYDLLRENLEYKLRFADHTYLYRSHIVFPKQPIFKWTTPLLHWLSLSLTFDVYYPALSKLRNLYHWMPLLPKRPEQRANVQYYFEEVSESERSNLTEDAMEPVNLEQETTNFLKRATYHFLYTTKDTLEDISVYRDLKNPHIFIIKGRKVMKKIVLRPTHIEEDRGGIG